MLLKFASLGPDSALADPADALRAALESDHDRLCRHLAVLVIKTDGPASRAGLVERVRELLAETAREALSHAANYDPSRPALPWLMGVAVNVLKSHRRQSARARQVSGSDLGERWDAVLERLCTGPRDEFLGDQLDLRQALERLDDKDRRTLRLRYFDGLDGEELARALGARTTGAARVRVCRALRALRARLGLAESEVES